MKANLTIAASLRPLVLLLFLLGWLAPGCAAPQPTLQPDDRDFAFVDLAFTG